MSRRRLAATPRSDRPVGTVVRAVLVAGAAIVLILEGLSVLAQLATRVVGLPESFPAPLAVRSTGGALIGAGVALGLWLVRYRRPTAMIVSTYATFAKMLRRTPAADPAGRAEPLVVRGPQRYVRHPLYLAATAVFVGWGLATGDTSSLVWALFALLWFRFVQAPFEEAELASLFGDAYRRYADAVPMLVPFPRPGRKAAAEARMPER